MFARLLSVALPSSLMLCVSSLSAQCGLTSTPIVFPPTVGSGFVNAAVALPSGDIVFGGTFQDRLVRWDGSTLQPLATGMETSVSHLELASNGDLLLAGWFQSMFPLGEQRVTRWDGASWSQLNWAPFNQQYALVGSLASGPANDVVVTGYFLDAVSLDPESVLRWNGSSWTGLGLLSGAAHDVVVATNGDIYIVGDFTGIDGVAANNIARFDGTSWNSVGFGVAGLLRRVMVLRDGTVVAFGDSAWRFDGTTLQPFGAFGAGDEPYGAIELPNGDLIVHGSLTSVAGVAVANMARFDGTSWSAYSASANRVSAVALRDDGTVVTAGGFLLSPVSWQPYAFEMATTCPATAVTVGVGCATSAGVAELASNNLPWVGTTFSAEASGLPTNAVALAVTGLSAVNIPIANLLPQGAPGCVLMATLDHTELLPIVAGQSSSSLVLPNLPVLAGITLRHQVAAFEFAVSGPLQSVTSTNALALTVGSL
tara:strand:- start:3685 stop:5133 length:1449 start_codon:yes stop_codon:yes gene_type:complete